MALPSDILLVDLLNNQPNGVRIGCSRYTQNDVINTPFHHLCRNQQVQQLRLMIMSGIDIIELQRELYLVAHEPTIDVWESFGYPGILFDSDD